MLDVLRVVFYVDELILCAGGWRLFLLLEDLALVLLDLVVDVGFELYLGCGLAGFARFFLVCRFARATSPSDLFAREFF